MTRFVLFCGLVLALAGTADGQEKKKDVPKELEPFQGSWRVLVYQLQGKDNAKGPSFRQRFTFEGNKVTLMEDQTEQFSGTFAADPKKEPAELDFIDAKGGKTEWIYKIDKEGKLTICCELSLGKDPPAKRPKKFETKDTSNLLFVLEKVK